MQDFNNVQMLELGAVPNLGDLLGSQSSAALTSYINSFEDSSQFFGSTYDSLQNCRQQFIDNLVTPVRQAGLKVVSYLDQMAEEIEAGTIKALETIDELRVPPAYMILPLITYEPLYRLHRQGRIYGYGLDPHAVKMVKPVYDRILRENGHMNLSDPPRCGGYRCVHEYHSTDPYLSSDQIMAIWDTEDGIINELLEETEIDPTDVEALRG